MAERVVQLLGPSTGGIRQHVGCLAEGLGARGWEVVIAGPDGVMQGVGRQDAVVPVPRGFGPRAVLSARNALASVVDGADLVHAHGLTPGWIAALLRSRPPLIVTIHNLVLQTVHGWRAPPLRIVERALPRRADSVIAVSRGIAERVGVDATTAVIPPAGRPPHVSVPAEEVRDRFGIPPGAPLIVTVARLAPQKDVPTFLRAVAATTTRDAHALVVGQGRERENLERLASQLGVSPRKVVFTGPLDNPADVMAAADVVVVSSVWESGPLVLFEAMLLGRPVVTTRVGLADELVVPGETGHLVPIGDHSAMAEAIDVVLANPAHAGAVGERGRERATAMIGPDALVDAVEDVYRATLSR